MSPKRKRSPLAFVGAVAGIALLAPYALNQAANAWPNSVIAKFNAGIHKGSS